MSSARDAVVERMRPAVDALGGTHSVVVDAPGARLHVRVYGEGPLDVVVLPGITSPVPTWDFVARWLEDLARIVVVDVRGRGLSDAPTAGYQLGDYVEDTVAVCDALELTEPVLLGHSMGARIAAAFGAAHPTRAGALILLDPPMSGPGRPYPTPWESFEQQLDEGIRGTDTESVRRYYPRWAERELQIRVDWLGTCDPVAIRETYDAFEVDRFEPLWAQLVRQPTLVYGGVSPVVTASDVAQLKALQPQATMLCVEGAGHMIPWDEPDATRVVLRSLVAPLSAAAAAPTPPGGTP